jgi:hypothetical protein
MRACETRYLRHCCFFQSKEIQPEQILRLRRQVETTGTTRGEPVFWFSEHEPWPSSREATTHPSSGRVKDVFAKMPACRWPTDARCTCPDQLPGMAAGSVSCWLLLIRTRNPPARKGKPGALICDLDGPATRGLRIGSPAPRRAHGDVVSRVGLSRCVRGRICPFAASPFFSRSSHSQSVPQWSTSSLAEYYTALYTVPCSAYPKILLFFR